MAFTLTSDPIMSLDEAQALFDASSEQKLILLVNSLTRKFLRFTNRVTLAAAAEITERLDPPGHYYLWLHAPIIDPDTNDIEASIYEGVSLKDTYTFSGGDLAYMSDDYSSRIALVDGIWPGEELFGRIDVTYTAGWSAVPADVIEGAMLQGRVDLKRMSGEVGLNSHALDGESTSFDTGGIIKTVRDLWEPYKVLS